MDAQNGPSGSPTGIVSNVPTLPGSKGPTPRVVVKVIVYQSGRITLDGEPVTLDALKDRFKRLKAEGEHVW
jgi:hypothetical protein